MIFELNIIAALLLVTLKNCVHGQKINIDIYYESLCPDSVKFINNQLYPNWAQISPYVNLHFVPFGKSKNINGGHDFECQHGPMECAGNKIQSCALSAVENTNAQVQFVHCFMNSFGKDDVGQTCAAQIGLDWTHIEQCYNSAAGTHLQLHAEAKTNTVAPTFVPTIIYNEVGNMERRIFLTIFAQPLSESNYKFNQEDQNESQTNFIGVVCKHLNKIHSGICKNY